MKSLVDCDIIIISITVINEQINVVFSPKTTRTRNTHEKRNVDDVFGRWRKIVNIYEHL